MIYLLIGYMWLFIHRPFEIWPIFGILRIERVYVISCVLYWLLLYPRKTWVGNRLNLALVFFWLSFLLTYLMSPFADAPEPAKTVEEYFKIVVFFLLLMGTANDEKQLRILILGHMVVTALYMTHSLIEFRNGRHVYRMGIARMVGVDQAFNDPNTFASTILYALTLTLAFWPEATNRKRQLFLLLYTGLTVLCILLTGSRSGMVGLICFGVLCLRRLFRNKVVLVFVIAAIPFGWLALPEELQNRFWTLIDPSVGPKNAQESAEGRSQGLYDGIALWQKNPLFGVGPGAFGRAVGHGAQAHNLYGQTLGEMGSLGAISFCWIVACFFLNGWEIRALRRREGPNQSEFPADLSRAIVVCVLLLLIKGNADHNLYRHNWLWFGAFQAIAVYCMRKRSVARSVGKAALLTP